VVDPAAAPVADVVALIVRERLTGSPPPAAAKALVESMRAEIEAKAGADLDRLTDAVSDQKAFARIARAVVRDLFMSDDLSDAPDQDAEDDAQHGASEDGGCDHQALMGGVEMQLLGDRHAQRSEQHPDHEAEVEIEEGGEQRRQMAGFEESRAHDGSRYGWDGVGPSVGDERALLAPRGVPAHRCAAPGAMRGPLFAYAARRMPSSPEAYGQGLITPDDHE
jgi:cobalamin biosynthesis protein CobT